MVARASLGPCPRPAAAVPGPAGPGTGTASRETPRTGVGTQRVNPEPSCVNRTERHRQVDQLRVNFASGWQVHVDRTATRKCRNVQRALSAQRHAPWRTRTRRDCRLVGVSGLNQESCYARGPGVGRGPPATAPAHVASQTAHEMIDRVTSLQTNHAPKSKHMCSSP